MFLILLSYASLINEEGIIMRKNPKGGLVGSIPWPVAGWVSYRLVSDLLVETLGRYGLGMLVRVSWSRSNFDRGIEKLERNGIAEATKETKRHRSSVMVRRIITIPVEFRIYRHCRIRRDPGYLDQLVRVSWSRSNFDRGIEKLERNGIAEATKETKRHRSSTMVRRIITIPVEFRIYRHCRIRRDPGYLDQWIGEQGSSDEKESRLRSQPSDPIRERDQRSESIAGNRVAWELISQGIPTIQTTVSLKGQVLASGELRGEKRVIPNHRCVPPQFENHAVM
jgi:hypothetical protein